MSRKSRASMPLASRLRVAVDDALKHGVLSSPEATFFRETAKIVATLEPSRALASGAWRLVSLGVSGLEFELATCKSSAVIWFADDSAGRETLVAGIDLFFAALAANELGLPFDIDERNGAFFIMLGDEDGPLWVHIAPEPGRTRAEDVRQLSQLWLERGHGPRSESGAQRPH